MFGAFLGLYIFIEVLNIDAIYCPVGAVCNV